MFGLAAPIWLVALAALAIPLLIHLWNLRPRRTIAFGSLQFLEDSPRRRRLSRWLSQWKLLLVRCALLSMLSLWLSGPFWSRESVAGWVLVSPQILDDLRNGSERYQLKEQQFVESLSSLQAAGHQLRLFEPPFPPTTLEAIPPAPTTADYWSLFRELEDRFDAPSQLWIFTPDHLSSLRGRRPTTRRNVIWQAFPSRGPKRWIEAAYRAGGKATVWVGDSESSRTLWHRLKVNLSDEAQTVVLPGFQVEVRTGRPETFVRILENGDRDATASPVLQLEPLPVEVTNPPGRSPDAFFLIEALRAIEEWSGRPLMIEARTVGHSPEETEPALSLRFGDHDEWFLDSGGGSYTTTDRSWLVPGVRRGAPIPLWRRSEPAIGVPLWLDSSGEPLLVLEEPAGNLRLATRLHPGWSGLAFDSAFVETLSRWILRDTPVGKIELNPGLDQRPAGASQYDPDRLVESRSDLPSSRAPLSTPVWALMIALFCFERWIADRRTR